MARVQALGMDVEDAGEEPKLLSVAGRASPGASSGRENDSARTAAFNGHAGVPVWAGRPTGTSYAALDLGTNNCRLLIARPTRRGFQVVDAFSRIIRLGEGLSSTGRLSTAAMARTIDALRVCAQKLARNDVRRARLIATEACRVAVNAPEFLDRVRREVGLSIEVLSREDEARLAVCGCASLIDPTSDHALVFDIGGGSSELVWMDLRGSSGSAARDGLPHGARFEPANWIDAWTSLPVGVVTLAEQFGGRHVTADDFNRMVDHVSALVRPFESEVGFAAGKACANGHFLGTSGTVTTVAGVWLGLPRYERARVDGCWLSTRDVRNVTNDLVARSYEERVAEPCIGRERADLVLAGCAILEALLRMWPTERLRVADRGLREGILTTLMSEDGLDRAYRGDRRLR